MLERSLRECIADIHDLSAEGLTHEEIARLLRGANVGEEQVSRLLEILGQCSQVRFAPFTASDRKFDRWAEDARAILVGGFR